MQTLNQGRGSLLLKSGKQGSICCANSPNCTFRSKAETGPAMSDLTIGNRDES